jgi:hypothetical protein
VLNGGNHGIGGTNVNGLTIANSVIDDAGDADEEDGIRLVEAQGTVTITNTAIRRAMEDLFQLLNQTNSVTVNITGSSFVDTDSVGATGNDAVSLQFRGSITPTVTVSGSSFTNIRGDSIEVGSAIPGGVAGNTATVTLNASTNTITEDAGDLNESGAFKISGQDSAHVRFHWNGNTFTGAKGPGVLQIDANDDSFVEGLMASNNVSGATSSEAIAILGDETAKVVVEANGNVITNAGGDAIQIAAFVGTPDLDVRLINNDVNGHNQGPAGTQAAGVAVFGGGICVKLQQDGTFELVTGTPAGFVDHMYDAGFNESADLLIEGPTTNGVTAADIRALADEGGADPIFILDGIANVVRFSNGVPCETPSYP